MQRERDHAKLAEIRHELTSVRAIVDHVARREHAKVAVVAATRALHAARMATPASARAALEGLAQAGEGVSRCADCCMKCVGCRFSRILLPQSGLKREPKVLAWSLR